MAIFQGYGIVNVFKLRQIWIENKPLLDYSLMPELGHCTVREPGTVGCVHPEYGLAYF
jgi:hypothetical protein